QLRIRQVLRRRDGLEFGEYIHGSACFGRMGLSQERRGGRLHVRLPEGEGVWGFLIAPPGPGKGKGSRRASVQTVISSSKSCIYDNSRTRAPSLFFDRGKGRV